MTTHCHSTPLLSGKVGQLHVGIFTILLMSGERNFGVRLNKPFLQRSHPDLPQFTGTHADLMYLTLHKVITSGLPRLQPLYDSLLTIMVNGAFSVGHSPQYWSIISPPLPSSPLPPLPCSVSVPQVVVHGDLHPTPALDGVLLHPLVPLCQATKPLPRLLPPGGLQQPHPVPV